MFSGEANGSGRDCRGHDRLLLVVPRRREHGSVQGPTGHTRASPRAERAGNMGREPVIPVERSRLGIGYLE